MTAEDKSLMVPGDDSFALKFLRANRFDYEEAHRMVKAYYRFQTSVSPELFVTETLESRIGQVFQDNVLVVLPKKTIDGQPIVVCTPGLWNPDNYSFDNLLAAFVVSLEILISSPANQLSGVLSVLDLTNISWTQVKSFGPNDARKLVHLVQDAFPARIVKIHVLNKSQLARMATQVIKPFTSPELASRTKLHSDPTSLASEIGAECLPEELGGSNGPLDGSDYFNRVVVPSKMMISRYWTCSGFGILPSEEDEDTRETGIGSQLKSTATSHLSSLKQLASSKGEPFMENFQSKIPDCVSNLSSFFK